MIELALHKTTRFTYSTPLMEGNKILCSVTFSQFCTKISAISSMPHFQNSVGHGKVLHHLLCLEWTIFY